MAPAGALDAHGAPGAMAASGASGARGAVSAGRLLLAIVGSVSPPRRQPNASKSPLTTLVCIATTLA